MINLLAALTVLSYFTRVTWVGLLLSFAVVQMVSHYFFKIVIQRVRDALKKE